MTFLKSYPEIENDYDLEKIKEELNDWHDFLHGELVREGKWVNEEQTKKSERWKVEDKMTSNLMRELVPRIIKKHKK